MDMLYQGNLLVALRKDGEYVRYNGKYSEQQVELVKIKMYFMMVEVKRHQWLLKRKEKKN